ncbi:MAG: hypothetical protein ACPLRP_02355 [Candidatus Bipolaricaulaceae bacterium]
MSKARCCDLSGVGFIEVGGRKVGIVGLFQAFREVQALGLSDPETAVALLARVKEQNWVPPESEGEYAQALLREYKRWQAGQP